VLRSVGSSTAIHCQERFVMSGSYRAQDAGPAVILVVACPAPNGCLTVVYRALWPNFATKYPLRCLRHRSHCGEPPCVRYLTIRLRPLVALKVLRCPCEQVSRPAHVSEQMSQIPALRIAAPIYRACRLARDTAERVRRNRYGCDGASTVGLDNSQLALAVFCSRCCATKSLTRRRTGRLEPSL
jgi:hypothetical protein